MAGLKEPLASLNACRTSWYSGVRLSLAPYTDLHAAFVYICVLPAQQIFYFLFDSRINWSISSLFHRLIPPILYCLGNFLFFMSLYSVAALQLICSRTLVMVIHFSSAIEYSFTFILINRNKISSIFKSCQQNVKFITHCINIIKKCSFFTKKWE